MTDNFEREAKNTNLSKKLEKGENRIDSAGRLW